MILTVIESPYAVNVEHNLNYVRACMADSLRRGEAPYASHALYTQPGVLDDTVPSERRLGMRGGFAWGARAARVAIYIDLGWSSGMKDGLLQAQTRRKPIRVRALGAPWSELEPIDVTLAAYAGASQAGT